MLLKKKHEKLIPKTMDLTGTFDIANAANAIYDIATQNKQFRQTQELQETQYQNQRKLNEQGQTLGMKTWKETNYPAQVAMLKEAGLNPGLLYSKGGAGGTTSTPSGGGAASGQAPSFKGMDIRGILDMQMIKAQIDNTKEDTRLKNVQANKEAGAETDLIYAQIEKLKAETTSTEAKNRLTEVEIGIAEIEKTNRQYKLDAEIGNLVEQARLLKQQGDMNEAAFNELIEEMKGRSVEQQARIGAIKAGVTLTKAETQAIYTSLQQKWTELGLEGERVRQADRSLGQKDTELGQKQYELGQRDKEITIKQFEAQIKKDYPGLMNVAGSIASKAYETLEMFTMALDTGYRK